MKELLSVLLQLLNRVTMLIEVLQDMPEANMPPNVYNAFFRKAKDLQDELNLALHQLSLEEFGKEDVHALSLQVQRLEAEFDHFQT